MVKVTNVFLLRKCYTFDAIANSWNLMKTRMLWPIAYAASVVSPDGNKLYIMGGNEDGNVMSSSQVSM